MQTRALFAPARLLAWRSVAARPRMADRSWHEASLAPGQIVCLRLTGQLCAGTADALVDAVYARLPAAMPPARAVVIDLAATPAFDDSARAALRSLRGLLSQSHARLRLVVPGTQARAALSSDGTATAIGLDALHTSVRAALLAEHAAAPGPALVTPAMYYSCCFSVCDRVAAQRDSRLRRCGYLLSPPSGRGGSGGGGCEASAVVVPAGAGLVAAAPC